MAYRCHRPETLAVTHRQASFAVVLPGKMADHRWKAFKKEMQGKSNDNDPRQNKEEIVVQRLSADVSGKA